MKIKKHMQSTPSTGFFRADARFDSNVENFKRRRALTPLSQFDLDPRSFFDRILDVKKFRELVFVSNARTKNR